MGYSPRGRRVRCNGAPKHAVQVGYDNKKCNEKGKKEPDMKNKVQSEECDSK